MDIRNFFSSKPQGKKSIPTSTTSSKQLTTQVESVDENTENAVTSKHFEKKRKPEPETPSEITPTEFFADTSTRKKPKTKLPKKEVLKEEVPHQEEKKSPSPKKQSPKKRIRVEVSSDEENEFQDEEFKPDDDAKENVADVDTATNDDDDHEVEMPPSPKKVAKPSPKKKAKAISPKQKSPKKAKAPKTPKSPKTPKIPILEPTLELDNFDTDKIQVSECMQGLTFVFTGILEGLSREDSADLIKIMGGRVTSAVSGRTSYLVAGQMLENGKPYTEGNKYNDAKEKKVMVCLGAKRLYGLCQLYHERAKKEKGIIDPPPTTPSSPPEAATVPKTPATKVQSTPASSKPVAPNPYAKKSTPPAITNPYAKKAMSNPYAKKAPATNPYAKSAAAANPYLSKKSAGSQSATSAPKANSANSLWVDRHAPTNTHEILGNKENITKLQGWLSSWERNFNNPKASGKSFSNPRGPWKAALLSGPPGIGKTTTATLVAKESGRDLIEFNASDVRSKKALQNGLGDITGSQSINFGTKTKQTKKSRCIIMDEVDGMGAGDRSGMSELIQMIKKSKVPIICICNDRQSQKMKSLLPYCMDLRFKRPTKFAMANRALRIAKMEGLDVEKNAAEAIAQSCGNDVRQVLNCLQMWAQKKNTDGSQNRLTYKGLKDREKAINKDEILRVSLFDAAKTIIEGRKGLAGCDGKTQRDNLYKRTDSFFVDYSLTGLLVQQNYLKAMISQRVAVKGKSDEEEAFLERQHEAAMSMSDYAVVEHEIRSGDLNWSLLPTCSVLTVKTGYHVGGEAGAFLPGFPEFTSWMGKNSTKGKRMRLLSELQYHMNYKITGDSKELRLSYLPVLREHILRFFKSEDESGVAEAIALMDEYGLSRDDVLDKFDEFKMGKNAQSFSDLDSKQKAAFTRQYNKGTHKSQALVSEQGGPATGKKKKGQKVDKDPADLDAIDEDVADAEESDADDEEELKKLREKFAKKGRKAAAKKKAKTKTKVN